MTNKEILAELKICWELLTDIKDNAEREQITTEENNEIWDIREKIDNIYFRLWNSMFASGDKEDEKDLIVEENDDEFTEINEEKFRRIQNDDKILTRLATELYNNEVLNAIDDIDRFNYERNYYISELLDKEI